MRIQHSFQLRDQRIECGSRLPFYEIHLTRCRFGTNDFLQSAGGGLNLPCADVSGDTLEGVGQAFREGQVALGNCSRNLLENGALLLDELVQEFQIQFPVSSNSVQSVVRVESFDKWKLF